MGLPEPFLNATNLSDVIETKRDAVPQVVINNLYKHTMLQSNFSIILLAIVDGKPEVLNLKQILLVEAMEQLQ